MAIGASLVSVCVQSTNKGISKPEIPSSCGKHGQPLQAQSSLKHGTFFALLWLFIFIPYDDQQCSDGVEIICGTFALNVFFLKCWALLAFEVLCEFWWAFLSNIIWIYLYYNLQKISKGLPKDSLGAPTTYILVTCMHDKLVYFPVFFKPKRDFCRS